MYNNEVTYHEKWDTLENIQYEQKLAKKYYSRTPCSSHIPNAWAKEVWEFLEELDKQFGIARKPHNTVRGLSSWETIKEEYLEVLKRVISPSLEQSYYRYYKPLEISEEDSPKVKEGKLKSNAKRKEEYKEITKLKVRAKDFFSSYKRLTKRLISFLIDSAIDWYRKPQIVLSQVKEKFGTIRVYANCSPAIRAYIREKENQLEIKLATKGAYPTLKSLWNLHIDERLPKNEEEKDHHWKFFHDVVLLEDEDGTKSLRRYTMRDTIRDLWRHNKMTREEVEAMVL